jgi:transcriptional regulator with XRE-family HTH domain
MAERARGGVPPIELRHRMAIALEWRGISVGEMADELGVHRNTVSAYLHGRARPRRSDLVAWALRCGVPFDWLLTGVEPSDHDGPPANTLRYIGTARSALRFAG